jgi:hypothetical protein
MEKFTYKKHGKYAAKLPFSYFSSPISLDFSAYTFERNGENLIVWQDVIFPHDFPSIFLPTKKENLVNASVAFATTEDIEKAKNSEAIIMLEKPVSTEFYYRTEDFVNPKGDLLRAVNRFKDGYEFELSDECPKTEIEDFYEKWKSQKERTSITFDDSEKFFNFCLDNLKEYSVGQVYVKSGGKLIGFAWGVSHPKGGWVGLHLKVNYEYKQLSKFLHHERAKLFADEKEFTLGTGAHEKGIDDYKWGLGSSRTADYSYILFGSPE